MLQCPERDHIPGPALVNCIYTFCQHVSDEPSTRQNLQLLFAALCNTSLAVFVCASGLDQAAAVRPAAGPCRLHPPRYATFAVGGKPRTRSRISDPDCWSLTQPVARNLCRPSSQALSFSVTTPCHSAACIVACYEQSGRHEVQHRPGFGTAAACSPFARSTLPRSSLHCSRSPHTPAGSVPAMSCGSADPPARHRPLAPQLLRLRLRQRPPLARGRCHERRLLLPAQALDLQISVTYLVGTGLRLGLKVDLRSGLRRG